MDKKLLLESYDDGSEMVRHALDYLRQRSLHRMWSDSARVAVRRGHSAEPYHPPSGNHPGEPA